MSVWDRFEQIKTEVEHVRPDNTGYVKSGGDLIEIGSISSNKGYVVEVALVSRNQGVCLTKTAVSGPYDKYEQRMIDKHDIRDDIEENDLLLGEEFSAEIIDINSSGIGCVKTDSGVHLKIGPISCEVGREVQLEFVGEGYARCLDESVRPGNYETRFNIFAERYDSVPVSVGEEYTGEVVQTYFDNLTAVSDGVHVNISEGGLNMGDKILFRVTGFASQSALGEFIEKKGSTNSNSCSSNSDGIRSLRERAEEQSQGPSNVSNVEKTVKQYSRSATVKQYAKARADGICEGCGSSAPFVDRDGEPYLQVHHLEELSDGGADEPGNVACLCPNCHYKIHHGKNGEEFNEQIASKIDRIED